MNNHDLFRYDDVALDIPAVTQHDVLAWLSETIGSRSGLDEDDIFRALSRRHKLGSTAINHGVAVPHARISSAKEPSIAFTRLKQPIEFGAPDGRPVDLVFAVIWPSTARDLFFKTLAAICRVPKEPKLLDKLRDTSCSIEAGALLAQAVGS